MRALDSFAARRQTLQCESVCRENMVSVPFESLIHSAETTYCFQFHCEIQAQNPPHTLYSLCECDTVALRKFLPLPIALSHSPAPPVMSGCTRPSDSGQFTQLKSHPTMPLTQPFECEPAISPKTSLALLTIHTLTHSLTFAKRGRLELNLKMNLSQCFILQN